ncbi:uncharacterized protein FA14DRAFT_183609 [Meira miltonrushii]|uniref:Secreted protein n=1 Tax=Meira miltonrushii TaxID=1280837 RepID=A0A316VJD4_9BASI|nr:uncharacterized protein FA14DRAFT_183609 [Meira miltonrushii]PWN37719.1 hypothetical protein FA14DRAFT_183609 [Meira miltonrushii]
MSLKIILLLIFVIQIWKITVSSSSSSNSSPRTSDRERMLPSDYDETEKSATKALYRLHKTDDRRIITLPATTADCGTVKNPHTMRCPHWATLSRPEKQKNRSRLRLLVIPDRIRLLKNAYARENMKTRRKAIVPIKKKQKKKKS